MPHNSRATLPVAANEALSVEQSLLGTLLTYREKFADNSEIVRPSDFIEPLHQAIYRAMLERFDLGEDITVTNIVARMGDEIPGTDQKLSDYLRRLMRDADAPRSISGSAKAVRDAAAMRELEEIAGELSDELARPGIVDPNPLANRMVSRLDTIIQANASDTAKPMSLGRAADMALQNMLKVRDGVESMAVRFGIPSLDRRTGGAKPGDLIILAGRPAMGKTAVGITMSLNAAKAKDTEGNHTTAVMNASLEMTAVDLAERALSAEAFHQGQEIPYQWISNGCDSDGLILTDAQVQALFDARNKIDTLPYWIEQQPGLSFSQLAARARRYFAQAREKGIRKGVLVVDYLGLVKADERYKGNKVHELGQITSGLKALAKELGVPVILLCQLSRAVEHRDDKHPQLSDLRDSGEIEQDADVVLFVYREEYYLKDKPTEGLSDDELQEHYARLSDAMNVLEIGVAKQRKGPTGWDKNTCYIECNVVTELRA